MQIAIPDMITNSYFPILATAELGMFKREGLDASAVLMAPIDKAYAALKHGEVDFVGGEAHAAPAVFPEWRGVKLLCAQAQGMYWFLVVRADLGLRRGDVAGLRGLRIGAAPWVELGLRRLLIEAGIDPERDGVQIAPIPGSLGLKVNTGVMAADALERRVIDGFWANGMGAEIAVERGVGTVVLDVRRGDGPKGCFDYTFAALATTEQMIERAPEQVAAAVRAIVATHKRLRQEPELAAELGSRLFPAREAALIGRVVMRDLPFYDAAISERSVERLSAFTRDVGLLKGHPSYADVVATQFCPLWSA